MALTITGGEDVSFEVASGNSQVADLSETGGTTTPPPGSPPGTPPVRIWSITGGADAAKFGINSSTGELYFIAVPDFLNPLDDGADNIYDVVVQVADPSGVGAPDTDTQAVRVTVVDPLLAAPQIATLGGASTGTIYLIEGNTYVIDANVTDATPGDTEFWTIDNTTDFNVDPANGAVLFNTPVIYDPLGSNSYQVEITVTDSTGRTDSQLITVIVLPVNSETQISSSGGGATASIDVRAGTTFVVDADAVDLTPNDGLRWSLGSSSLFTIDEPTGILSFIDPPVFVPGGDNSYEVEILVDDTVAGSDSQIITVNVVNDPPVSDAATISLNEDTAINGTLVATDPESAALTYAIVTNPLNGTISNFNAATGAYTYTPNANYSGPDSFTFRANDGTLDSNIATVGLTVAAVNDAPVVTIVPTSSLRLGGEIVVNTTTFNPQDQPAVASLVAGGFVVSWRDTSLLGGDASISSIKAQVFDSTGAPVGVEFLVNTTTPASQLQPTITSLNGGGFVVSWRDESAQGGDTSLWAIRAQVFDVAGARVGGELLVNTTTSGRQSDPTIASLTSGGFVVSWTDESGLGGDASGASIKAQIFDAVGTRVGNEFLANSLTTGSQFQPTIAGFASGGFVVLWGSGQDIKGQIFAASGTPVGSEFVVASSSERDSQPAVTMLASGNFAVSWSYFDPFSGSGEGSLKARVFNSSGQAITGEILVQPLSLSPTEIPSAIAPLPQGGFVVTWGNSASTEIFARMYDGAGSPVGARFTVTSGVFRSQSQQSIAPMASGGFVISWYDSLGDASFGGIKAQIFGPLVFLATEQTATSLKGSATVSDVDVGSAALTATLAVDYGILTVTAGNSGATVTNSGTSSVTVMGTLAQINALLGATSTSTVTFTANTDASPASAAFTVTVNDNGGTGMDAGLTGGAGNEIGSATVAIAITGISDAPQGANTTVTMFEDVPRALSATDFGFSDIDGDSFAGVVLTTLPALGTLRLNGVPITVAGTFVTAAQVAANELVYTSAANASGATYASFTFQVRDTGSVTGGGVITDATANTLILSVTAVDDAPTLTATGTNPVFTENGSPVDLFSSVAASVVETGQTFTGLTMTVANVTNGSSERLTVDGATFTLQDGSGANPTTNGLNIRVSVTGSTATVSFSGASLTAAQLQTIIDQMTYQQFGDAPVDTNLVFTITQLTDSGSNAAPNSNTAALALTSTVNVNPVNDAPTLTGVPLNFQLTRNATLPLDYSSVVIADPDSVVTATILASGGGTLAAAGSAGITVGGSGATLTLTGTGAALTSYLDTVTNITYTPPLNFSGNGNAFSISVSDGIAPSVGNATQSVVVAPISLTTAGLTVSENFDSLAATGTTNQLVLGGWSLNETGTSTTNNELYAAGAGTGTTGDVYSLGALATDRALGTLLSGTLQPIIGVAFTNNTGATITALQIAYTGEQWRIGNITAGRAPDRLDFQLSTDATSLTNGAWTDYNSFDFSSPVTTGGAIGSLDGNAAGNRVSFNLPITNISIAPGATFWLRWVDFDAAGADDALAIDNFSIIAFTNVAPVVDLDSGSGGNDAAVAYTENAVATPIGPLATVTDADVGDRIVSAVVTLTDPRAGDALALSAALPAGITAVTTATTITLTGVATPADYTTALRLVTFASSNDDPTGVSATRTFTVTTNDGDANSVTRTSVVTITPVNDAPFGTDVTIALVEDTPRLLTVADFGFGDIDGNAFSEVLITAATGGTVFFDADGPGGAGPIAITTFPQSYAAADFTAGRVSFQSNANLNGTGVATLAFTVRDNGGGANGGIDTDQSANTITFNVAAVDDAPVAVADPTNPVNENATVAIDVRLNDTDVDGGPMNISTINGTTATIGSAITLASGATATLNADGTITYNPNGRFNALIDTATAAATNALNTSATDSFTYALNGGSAATVTVTVNGVASVGDQLGGSAGNNALNGTPLADTLDLGAGGNDTVNGGDGNDAFNFGATFDAFDTVDGGLGDNDQVGLFGNYSGGIVLGPNTLRNIELLAALPGSGAGYDITSNDGNVAAGQELVIFGGNLLANQPFTFDGRAELDGRFRMFGGLGTDAFFGGALDDGFYFGPGKWGPGDNVVGGGGTNDQLALDGNYTLNIGASADVETLILLAGPAGSQNIFDITLLDSWTGPAATKRVWGLNVTTAMTIDGSSETDGSFIFFGGRASDLLVGGAGADVIYGGGGGDVLRGEGGADVFRYDSVTDSNGTSDATRDRIAGFVSGTDKIDLSRIDAIAGGADDSFTFIGTAAFSGGGAAGQLRYTDPGGGIFVVEGDVDGDGIADFAVSVISTPPTPPVATDFIL